MRPITNIMKSMRARIVGPNKTTRRSLDQPTDRLSPHSAGPRRGSVGAKAGSLAGLTEPIDYACGRQAAAASAAPLAPADSTQPSSSPTGVRRAQAHAVRPIFELAKAVQLRLGLLANASVAGPAFRRCPSSYIRASEPLESGPAGSLYEHDSRALRPAIEP